jgi:hypothetical protein
MGRYASDTGGSFTPAPTGTHVARCVKLIDLGTQHSEYKGEPTRRNQVLITWELPQEPIEIDGKEMPQTTSKFYTNSLGEKANLRRDLESWRGKAFTEAELDRFDLEAVLGKPCLLTIVSGENGKTKVAGVSGLAKGMECPAQVNESFSFWLDEFDAGKFEKISDGIKKIIQKSEEWPSIVAGGEPDYTQSAPVQDDDSDVPF